MSTVTLVTQAVQSQRKPRLEARSSREILAGLLRENPNLYLVFEHQIIGEEPLKVLIDLGAKSWDPQQILRFAAGLRSKGMATLLVDADTLVLPRLGSSQGATVTAGGHRIRKPLHGFDCSAFLVEQVAASEFHHTSSIVET